MRSRRSRPKFHDVMSPEIKQAFDAALQDQREGNVRPAPNAAKHCRSLEDLCRYAFKLAHLDGEYQMLRVGAAVRRWIWYGHAFTDRLVSVVEDVAPLLCGRDELEKLRLVATRVSSGGVERLRRAFPNARVRVYSDAECDADWQLSQASYSVKAPLHGRGQDK